MKLCFSQKSIISFAALFFFLVPYACLAIDFAGGTGDPNDPYQVATAEQLIGIGDDPNLYEEHFILINDLDLDPNLPGGQVFYKAVIAKNVKHKSSGFHGIPFGGVFDGNGHVIRNLTINGDEGYLVSCLGLFGSLDDDACVKDLGIVDANICGYADIGILAGVNRGYVNNCYTSGVVHGRCSGGGLVGENYGRIRNSHSISAVSGTLVSGGLVGENFGQISYSYSTGTVSGVSSTGGLVGENHGPINVCMHTGPVQGHYDAGGLVGDNDDRITNSYSTGSVAGDRGVGGLVGHNEGYLNKCYSGALVEGDFLAGGLVGATLDENGDLVSSDENVVNCFWDTQASDQTISAGGTGLDTEAMMTINTYLEAGWDFLSEQENGLHQFWMMPDPNEYPVLSLFNGSIPELAGYGTEDDPFLVSSLNDLGVMVYCDYTASYRLTADLDLSGICWSTAVIPEFYGVFDGNNAVIQDLTIDGGGVLGLFGIVQNGAQIANLRVMDANVTGTGDEIGILAGYNAGNITGCTSDGSVSGYKGVGGLVGYSYRGSVTDSSSSGTVVGTKDVGALVGYSWYGVDDNCDSTCLVNGEAPDDIVGHRHRHSNSGTGWIVIYYYYYY